MCIETFESLKQDDQPWNFIIMYKNGFVELSFDSGIDRIPATRVTVRFFKELLLETDSTFRLSIVVDWQLIVIFVVTA